MENYIYINLFINKKEGKKTRGKEVFIIFMEREKVKKERNFFNYFQKVKKKSEKCNHCLTLNK